MIPNTAQRRIMLLAPLRSFGQLHYRQKVIGPSSVHTIRSSIIYGTSMHVLCNTHAPCHAESLISGSWGGQPRLEARLISF